MMNYEVNASPAMCSPPATQMPLTSEQRSPRASVRFGDSGERELIEQLVASLKDVVPALQSLQQELQAAAEQHEAQSEKNAALMKLQVEVGKLNDKLDSLKKVEEQQTEAESVAVRLKNIETLLEQRYVPVSVPIPKRPSEEEAAVRCHLKPNGWRKLSSKERVLLRRKAFERLRAGHKMFYAIYGALGTHSATHTFDSSHLLVPAPPHSFFSPAGARVRLVLERYCCCSRVFLSSASLGSGH